MINRIKKWVNRLSVTKKIIFYGYVIVTPLLVAASVTLFFVSHSSSVSEKKKRDVRSASNLANNIYTIQEDIKNFSTYICINSDVQYLLKTRNINYYNQNARLWLEEAPMQMVQDMMSLKGNIKNVAIYPENGIRPYLRCVDGSTFYPTIKEVRKTHSYKSILEHYNSMMWLSIPQGSSDVYSYTRESKEVFYRTIYDFRLHRVIGIVMIGTDKDTFLQLCDNEISNEEEGVVVLDKLGGELLRRGNVGSDVIQKLNNEKFLYKNYKKRKKYISYNNYNIIVNQLTENSSIVCKIVPKYRLRNHFFDVVIIPVLVFVGMLLILLPILLLISRIVTKPLSQVSEAIRKFAKGDFTQRVNVSTNDEIAEVADCFNTMVEDIKSLIDENYVITLKEKESELNALQSQINPHFLYNTLDSLYWQATGTGQEELADSILALSDLFKLVLSRGSSEVPVEREMELIARYLQIQKMRFSKRLEYSIDVDEEAKDKIIPKLIIQPFVENAIVHGLENISTTCTLTVTASVRDNYLHFEVTDTGIGMTKEEVASLWEDNKQYANQRIGRYAIKNIKERLEIKYGGDFKLEIQSEKGRGTKVIIDVPIRED